jgi:hypothetical protein
LRFGLVGISSNKTIKFILKYHILKLKQNGLFKNILETIGNTPLVKLNKIVAEIDALVLAKVETLIQEIL